MNTLPEFKVWKTYKGFLGEYDLVLVDLCELNVEKEWGGSEGQYFMSSTIAHHALEQGLKFPSMEIARYLLSDLENPGDKKYPFALVMNEYGEVCAVDAEEKILDTLFRHIGFRDDEKFKFVFVKPRK